MKIDLFCSYVTDFDLVNDLIAPDYFRYFFHLFSVSSFTFSKNGRVLILVYPQRTVLNYSLSSFKGWFNLWSFYSVENASCLFTCI